MSGPERTLTSWKEIGAYPNRSIRTCQKLETTMGLSIHRLDARRKRTFSPTADPDLAEAHGINAWVQFVYKFDYFMTL